MDKLGDLVSAVKPRRDGDLVDRLNYTFTVSVLAAFAGFTGGWSYMVGTPIKCWYPAYFKGFWVEYANEYCFIQNTYFLKMHEGQNLHLANLQKTMTYIPQNITDRMEHILPYYQWAPFMLAFQAFFFFLPMVIWRAANGASGMSVDTILVEAAKSEMEPDGMLDRLTKFLTLHHDVSKETRHRQPGRRSYVTWLYVCVKFLFAFNAVMQFFLMNEFLGYGGPWGAQVFSNLLAGKSWMESGKFPRVTFCDFRVRVLGNLHRHTVQCVLMINMFYEKFYVGFWFWLLFIATVNIICLIQWIVIAVTYKDRGFVNEYINWANAKRSFDQVDQSYGPVVDRFIQYLGRDVIFLLKMINTNAGGVATGKLVQRLWDSYLERGAMSVSPGALPSNEASLQHSPQDEGIGIEMVDRGSSRSSSKESAV